MGSLPERSPIIRGELVYLRAPERSDIGDFVRWFNDAEVLDNLAMSAPMSEAAETVWFDRMLERQGSTDFHFVICLLDGDRAIGTAGLHGIDHVNGSAEFGIAIGEKAEWDKGYGTDALRAICDFGFGELRLEQHRPVRLRGQCPWPARVREGRLQPRRDDAPRPLRPRASRGRACHEPAARRVATAREAPHGGRRRVGFPRVRAAP